MGQEPHRGRRRDRSADRGPEESRTGPRSVEVVTHGPRGGRDAAGGPTGEPRGRVHGSPTGEGETCPRNWERKHLYFYQGRSTLPRFLIYHFGSRMTDEFSVESLLFKQEHYYLLLNSGMTRRTKFAVTPPGRGAEEGRNVCPSRRRRGTPDVVPPCRTRGVRGLRGRNEVCAPAVGGSRDTSVSGKVKGGVRLFLRRPHWGFTPHSTPNGRGGGGRGGPVVLRFFLRSRTPHGCDHSPSPETLSARGTVGGPCEGSSQGVLVDPALGDRSRPVDS